MASPSHRRELAWANTAFQEVFDNGLYTTLPMIDFLVKKQTGLTYRDWLINPFCVFKKEDYMEYRAAGLKNGQGHSREPADHEFPYMRKWLNQLPDKDPDLAALVSNGTGRCTSFTIEVVHKLNRQHPDTYEFSYYRMGNHHLARCARTGIVIDSSSKRGAFILQSGEELRVESEDYGYQNYWCFDGPNETSRFSKCHKTNPDFNQPKYHGCIKFELQQQQLEIRPSTYKGDKFPSKILFSLANRKRGVGSKETDYECRQVLEDFIDTGVRGCSYREQYKKVSNIVREIWKAAIDVFGYPVLTARAPTTMASRGIGRQYEPVIRSRN
ncbi:hypothetical protein V8F33_013689 [Rhypophila sp. PSN 637]